MRRLLTACLLPLMLSACVVMVPVPLPQGGTGGEPARFLEDPSGAQLNALRQRHGLAPLSHSPVLEKVAQGHATDIAGIQKMTHTGSDGSQLGDRVKRSGYNMRRAAENVALNGGGLDGAMQGWINSPPHLKNMLKPDVSEYGIARSGNYWVMVLARTK